MLIVIVEICQFSSKNLLLQLAEVVPLLLSDNGESVGTNGV